MKHAFISRRDTLLDRWAEAFPDAQLVPGFDELAPAGAEEIAIAWLDLRDSGNPLEAIGQRAEGWRVVAMADLPSEAQAFQLLGAGASGYCHSHAAASQLREIAGVVAQGSIWMPPELLGRLVTLSGRLMPGSMPEDAAIDELTERELAVARQVARGASNREIADALGISERTVKSHLSVVFDKMGVRDRVQLALVMNNLPVDATVH
jgi:two-component system nitrate/nitrite response regulator NarL